METKGYGCNEEYMEDLFCMLDAFLGEGEQILEEGKSNMFLSGERLQELQRAIVEREEQTQVCTEIPFLQISRKKQVTGFVKFCFILGWAAIEHRQYRECFSRIQEERQWYATKGLAVFLYQLAEPVGKEEFNNMRTGDGIWDVCFRKPEEQTGFQSWREEPVLLYPEFQQIVYGTYPLPAVLLQMGRLWNYTEPLGGLLFRKEQKNRLSLLSREPADQRIIMITGKQGSGRLLTLKHVLKEQKKNLLILDGQRFEKDFEDREEEIRRGIKSVGLIYRAELCITAPGKAWTEEQAKVLEKLAEEGGRIYLISEEATQFSRIYVREQIEIHMPEPKLKEKNDFWRYFLQQYPHDDMLDKERLGNRYVLNAGEIRQVVKDAFLEAESRGREKLKEEDIIHAVRSYNRNRPDIPAQRVETVYMWEDLVVEQTVEERLHHICNQIIYRELVGESWGFYDKRPYGRGISALFYGPPGTGKTMASQVIARELGMDLYRVDISRMMSKYIGETQKHMSQLFTWAKDSNALLFFDEADALFHRRTEVSDANDRHANSEVAHLLQQLEEYEGVVILATNLKENIDEAFKRRIKCMVGFKMPDKEIRRKLWNQMLPGQAPVEENLVLDFFAEQFELSGSEIKEVIMQAAFLAAAQGSCIGNSQIWKALEICYEKYGRRLGKEEFEVFW